MNENQSRARRRSHRLKRVLHRGGKRIAALFTVSLLLPGIAGCTPKPATSQPSASAGADAGALVDPLSQITDKRDPDYVAESIQPILHAEGLGPSSYEVHIDTETHSVRAYIVCAPDSAFTVTIDKRFFGQCAQRFSFFADLPVEPGDREVSVTVPDATQFILVVIRTPA